ncbi:MAG: 6,7-dimethyl-8-ribityllumazine synthase [Proteobacteria bacterium]|nr:6,7-dimethyl-8-ribityllumazine synthase [Pseudomonadota bacterium]
MDLKSREINGTFNAPSKNIAIVASRFNEFIVDRLISGAFDSLLRYGVKNDKIEIFRVPGAYEIPIACQSLAKTGRYAGIVTLGVVIRGETTHFDYVAGPCANGILQAQLSTNIPMTFGVLTTENIEQAVARAGATAGNKGSEAAVGLLEMINLLGKIND